MDSLSEDELNILLSIAKKAVIEYVSNKKVVSPEEFSYPEKLNKKAGVFVTLERLNTKPGEEKLRGCIGLPYPVKPLIEGVIEAAIESCSSDPRFPPVKKEELPFLSIEVSVLTEPVEIPERSWQGKLASITPYKDGIILKNGYYTALFLPQVWEQLPEREEFLSHLSLKAGLPPHYWRIRETVLYKFRVFSIKDKLVSSSDNLK